MYKATEFEIINHGIDHEQYFPGCGTAFSDFDVAITGVGYTSAEAYQDAVECCYQGDIDSKSLDKLLPKRPRGWGINRRKPVSRKLDAHHYYVTIRLKLKEAK